MAKPVTIKIVNKENLALQYAHETDAGVDLRANLKGFTEEQLKGDGCSFDEERNKLILFPGGRALIPTGIHTQIPVGYVLEIVPRSGLALKNGISVLNTPGTIDAGYRGEIGVILFNFSDEIFEIEHGDRIAQAVLHKFEKIKFEPVDSLDDSDRGIGGFGSTGV